MRFAIAPIVVAMPGHQWWAGPCIPRLPSGWSVVCQKSTSRRPMSNDTFAAIAALVSSTTTPKCFLVLSISRVPHTIPRMPYRHEFTSRWRREYLGWSTRTNSLSSSAFLPKRRCRGRVASPPHEPHRRKPDNLSITPYWRQDRCRREHLALLDGNSQQ